jgi:hypothetical protein
MSVNLSSIWQAVIAKVLSIGEPDDQFRPDISMFRGNPNGFVRGGMGDLVIDIDTPALWQKTTPGGEDGWVVLSATDISSLETIVALLQTEVAANTTNIAVLQAEMAIQQTEFFDIRNYGASTASPDNTAAIQATINAATAVGTGTVLVPPGTFSFASQLTDPAVVPIVCMGELVFTGSGQDALVIGGGVTAVNSPSTFPSVINLRRASQDWTDVFAGLAIVNVRNFHASVTVQDFETGFLLLGNNAGIDYCLLTLQLVFGCRVGGRFRANGTGFCNENIVFGGRVSTLQATNTALNIHGFEFVCDSNNGQPNGNKVWGVAIELHNVGTGFVSAFNGAFSVGSVAAHFNEFTGLRSESDDPYIVSGEGVRDNTFGLTYANIFNEATALDIIRGDTAADDLVLIQNVFETNVITLGSNDPIRVAGYSRPNVVAVGASLWRPARGVTWNRATTSIANTVTGSLNADTLTIANADGMAVVLDLRNVDRDYQRFLTLKAEVRATGGRLFCVCWDAAFMRLTGADDCSLAFNAGVGYYRTGGDMTVDAAEANVSFGANVAFVLCGVASGTASAQITQFDVFALGAADIRPVYGVDLLNSLSTAPPNIGTYDSGDPISNAIPSVPGTLTFYPAGLICRNVLAAVDVVEGWVYTGSVWVPIPTVANPNFNTVQINTGASLLLGDGSTNGDVLIQVRKADANNQNFLEHRVGTASSGARWRRQFSSTEAINVNRLDTSGINPVTFYQDDYVNIIRRMRRMILDQGTTVANANLAVSAGMGTGASAVVVNPPVPKDQNGGILVTVGTVPGANPTVTLTFADGAFPNAPNAQVVRNGGTGVAITSFTWTTSATTLVITFVGTPIAGETYVLTYRI